MKDKTLEQAKEVLESSQKALEESTKPTTDNEALKEKEPQVKEEK
jgi:hypothetical protein